MSQSFSASRPVSPTPAVRRKVLVTGASGNIGSYFAEHSHDRYELRLMVRDMDKDAEALRKYGQVCTAELDELDRLKELCAGVDTVLHLAASAGPSTAWDDVLENNIVGCYNVYVAAKAAGCRRVVFASSIHAVSGYPADVQVKASDPVNPGDLYGVSKCFGEALGRYMAEQEGLSVICLRIGGFQPHESMRGETGINMLDAWVSRRDLNQLIQKSIDADGIRFAIFNGLSNNRFKRLDISNARELVGYAPQDDLTEVNPELKPLRLRERVYAHSLKDDHQESGIRHEVRPTDRRGAGGKAKVRRGQSDRCAPGTGGAKAGSGRGAKSRGGGDEPKRKSRA